MYRFIVSVTAIRLQQNLLHREFWIQLFAERIFPLVIPLFAWMALFDFAGASTLAGWERNEMAAYYILIFFIGIITDILFHYEMSAMVHFGTLSQWLIRPISMFETILSHIIARVLLLSIPAGAMLLLFFIINPAAFLHISLSGSFRLILVLPLTLIIFSCLSVCIGMLSFWIIKTDSVFALTMLVLEFFGGRMLPVDLLPAWLQTIGNVLPLRFAIAGPAEAVLRPSSTALLPILSGQILWCIILSIVALLLWRTGISRFDAVGG